MDSTTAAAARPKKPDLFINRNFALLWTGGAVSVLGDMVFDFTLTIWIALFLGRNQTWAPLAVSGVLLAALAPMFLFGPIAGVFVDRWDKRRTMLRMDALRAVLIALLILATNTLPLPFVAGGRLPLVAQLGAIYGAVFLNSLFSQFFSPAKMALVGDIVPEVHRAQAGGLTQGSQSIGMLLGPAFAPILALTVGVQWALLINALSFAISFLMILAIRAPQSARSVAPGQRGNFLHEFGQGLAFAVRNRFVGTMVVAGGVIMFGAAATNALDLFFVITNLHTPAKYYGLLSTGMGVGLILGSVLAGVFAQRIGLVRTLNLALLVTGLCLLAYARSTGFVPALIFISIVGVFQAALNVVIGPILLRVTPRVMVGRVMAVLNPTVALMQILGTILAGYIASDVLPNFHQTVLGVTFGTYDTIFTGGALIAILGVLYAVARLGFRDPPAQAEAQPDLLVAPVLNEVAE